MKSLALLLLTAMPLTPGVTDPEYVCNLEKGYCVVKVEVLQEMQNAAKRRCMGFET